MDAGPTSLDPGVWSVHAETVFDVFVVQVEDNHGKDVSDPEIAPHGIAGLGPLKHSAKRNFHHRLGLALLEKN